MKKIFYCFVIVLALAPLVVVGQSYEYDLGLKPVEFVLSKEVNNLIAGEKVRVYTYVVNYGLKDATGNVVFYRGAELLGQAEVSVTAKGVKDEVFIDITVPSGNFNILAKLINVVPQDENTGNNTILSQMYFGQEDSDKDGLGNSIDLDDDNDGVSDVDEAARGTDAFKADTDGDGVNDAADEFPLDPTKSKKELPKPPVVKTEIKPLAASIPTPMSKQLNAPVASSLPAPKPIKPATTIQNDKEVAAKAEIVREYYASPQIELLRQAKISVLPVNWNTYNFSFTVNSPDIDVAKLDYAWSFSDGTETKVNGEHKFRGAGQYFVSLKVRGPWDNYLFDGVTVNVSFWSVFNYWLWLIVLALLIVGFLYAYGRRGEVGMEDSVEEKRELRQPRKRTGS